MNLSREWCVGMDRNEEPCAILASEGDACAQWDKNICLAREQDICNALIPLASS